jgi:hypothetical protein
MKADEATEHLEKATEGGGDNKGLAVYIAVLAVLLALAALGGSNAAKDMANENILASDSWNFYQAKSVRQTQFRISADILELELKSRPDMPADARAAYEEKIKAYRATVVRYDSEPENGEGKKELMAKAKAHEAARDHAGDQDPWFDAGESALQIAIVLASVSAIVSLPVLTWISGALALGGALATLNGYLLLF